MAPQRSRHDLDLDARVDESRMCRPSRMIDIAWEAKIAPVYVFFYHHWLKAFHTLNLLSIEAQEWRRWY